MLYPVNEIFYSIQGEGFHTGRPAVFIRLSGCNLKCPWCDTDHSKILKKMDEVEITRLVREKVESIPNGNDILIVITGGEPTLYNLIPLCDAITKFELEIAIETNGFNLDRIPYYIWKTVSPKIKIQDCSYFFDDVLWMGDEIKIVFEEGIDIELLKKLPKILKHRFKHFYIQPCSENFQPAVDFVKENPQWTLSVQIQKIINIS